MAEVQQNDGGKGKKGHQKKMQIRVDFTPMVDMNMLLITFFMLCTTMIKSQTLTLALPSNDKIQDEANMTEASSKDAITIIVDAKRKPGSFEVDTTADGRIVPVVYYYFGKPGGDNGLGTTPESISANNNLQESEFLGNDEKSGKARGIRSIIQERNKEVLTKIDALKKKYAEGGFGSLETKDGREKAQEEYDKAAKLVRNDSNLTMPTIIIKSTKEASFGSLVSLLDEMQINSISKYQIDNMNRNDSVMLIDYRSRHQSK